MAPYSVKSYPAGVAKTEATLSQAKRRAAMEHLLESTRKLVAQRGLDVTMEQLAEASGVSRRTLFRHFETRERLIAAAVASGVRRYGERLPTYEGGDWRAWLRRTCEVAHRMNASYGPGYWQLVTRTDLPLELAEVERRRGTARKAGMAMIAETAWHGAGNDSKPPADVTASVISHLSAHFTAAVTTEAGRGWQTAAELAYVAIVTSIESNAQPAS